ncbi:MAG: hypothetical protein GY761_18635, partial [Hyphomicrobiales bacterium]|nr:hypothetical protein [Hyphomicrobiales bacterium]
MSKPAINIAGIDLDAFFSTCEFAQSAIVSIGNVFESPVALKVIVQDYAEIAAGGSLGFSQAGPLVIANAKDLELLDEPLLEGNWFHIPDCVTYRIKDALVDNTCMARFPCEREYNHDHQNYLMYSEDLTKDNKWGIALQSEAVEVIGNVDIGPEGGLTVDRIDKIADGIALVSQANLWEAGLPIDDEWAVSFYLKKATGQPAFYG